MIACYKAVLPFTNLYGRQLIQRRGAESGNKHLLYDACPCHVCGFPDMVLAVIKEPVTEGRKGHGGRSCQTVTVFLLVAGGVGLPREAHFLDFLVRAVPLFAVERDVVQRGAVFLIAVHVGRACLRHVQHLLDAGGVPCGFCRSWYFLSACGGGMCYNIPCLQNQPPGGLHSFEWGPFSFAFSPSASS